MHTSMSETPRESGVGVEARASGRLLVLDWDWDWICCFPGEGLHSCGKKPAPNIIEEERIAAIVVLEK